jgi:hypothetical protein
MKIILATTTLIALLALGIIGTNSNSSSLGNAFAQMDPENPPLMEEDKSIGIMTLSNQSEPMANWTGTINVKSTIGEAFKSKVNVNMIDAIKVALVNVGLNSTVIFLLTRFIIPKELVRASLNHIEFLVSSNVNCPPAKFVIALSTFVFLVIGYFMNVLLTGLNSIMALEVLVL